MDVAIVLVLILGDELLPNVVHFGLEVEVFKDIVDMAELFSHTQLEGIVWWQLLALFRAIVDGKIDRTFVELEFGSKVAILPEVFGGKMISQLIYDLQKVLIPVFITTASSQYLLYTPFPN